jgi:hypothetical protein
LQNLLDLLRLRLCLRRLCLCLRIHRRDLRDHCPCPLHPSDPRFQCLPPRLFPK